MFRNLTKRIAGRIHLHDLSMPNEKMSLRWMDAVESDLRRLNIKRWRKKAEDRNEWKDYL